MFLNGRFLNLSVSKATSYDGGSRMDDGGTREGRTRTKRSGKVMRTVLSCGDKEVWKGKGSGNGHVVE